MRSTSSHTFRLPTPFSSDSDVALYQQLYDEFWRRGVWSDAPSPARLLEPQHLRELEQSYVQRVLLAPGLVRHLEDGQRLSRVLRRLPEVLLTASRRRDLQRLVRSLRESALRADGAAYCFGRWAAGRGRAKHTVVLRGGDIEHGLLNALPWIEAVFPENWERRRREPRDEPSMDNPAVALALILAPGSHLIDLREMLPQPPHRGEWAELVDQARRGAGALVYWPSRTNEELPPFPTTARLALEVRDPAARAAHWLDRIPDDQDRQVLLRKICVGLRRRYKITSNREYQRASIAVSVFAGEYLARRDIELDSPFTVEDVAKNAIRDLYHRRDAHDPVGESLLYQRIRRLVPAKPAQDSPASNRIAYYELEFDMLRYLVWDSLVAVHEETREPSPLLRSSVRTDRDEMEQRRLEMVGRAADLCRHFDPDGAANGGDSREQGLRHSRLSAQAMSERSTVLFVALHQLDRAERAFSPSNLERTWNPVDPPNGFEGLLRAIEVALENDDAPPSPAGLHEDHHQWLDYRGAQFSWGHLAPWLWLLVYGVTALERVATRYRGGDPKTEPWYETAYQCLRIALLLSEGTVSNRVDLVVRTMLAVDFRAAAWRSADRTFLETVRARFRDRVPATEIDRVELIQRVLERRYLLQWGYHDANSSAARNQTADYFPRGAQTVQSGLRSWEGPRAGRSRAIGWGALARRLGRDQARAPDVPPHVVFDLVVAAGPRTKTVGLVTVQPLLDHGWLERWVWWERPLGTYDLQAQFALVRRDLVTWSDDTIAGLLDEALGRPHLVAPEMRRGVRVPFARVPDGLRPGDSETESIVAIGTDRRERSRGSVRRTSDGRLWLAWPGDVPHAEVLEFRFVPSDEAGTSHTDGYVQVLSRVGEEAFRAPVRELSGEWSVHDGRP